jgi:hypothetical protein
MNYFEDFIALEIAFISGHRSPPQSDRGPSLRPSGVGGIATGG